MQSEHDGGVERDLVRERYYEHRAPVYDETSYRGDPEIDAGLDRESKEIGEILSAETGGRVLEVGCGTGLWTPYLRGHVVGIDLIAGMLQLARQRIPELPLVQARVPLIPFATGAFDQLVTANFYGLLRPAERLAFLAEASRLARELIVIDLRSDTDEVSERIETRRVDGSTYGIFRRRFTPEALQAELDAEVLYPGELFLAVRKKLTVSGNGSSNGHGSPNGHEAH
ncbi:MAG TPA: class I SAM-dependent methyltransferase [Acidimicrobiales bacterium]